MQERATLLDLHLRWKRREGWRRYVRCICSARRSPHSLHRGVYGEFYLNRLLYHIGMAKRKSKSTYNKIQPSELTLTFSFDALLGQSFRFIDISQVASLVNRRFYRQGLNWAVAGMKIKNITGTSNATIQVSKLPNTWIMSNSWEKSFRTWAEMQNKALDMDESLRPRFNDFKIYADAEHHNLGSDANLLPVSSAGALATAGDWDYSVIQVPDTNGVIISPGSNIERVVNTFDLIATGQSYPGASPFTTNDAVSLIEGYASSRALPNNPDPNTPIDARDTLGSNPENWMSAIFNEGMVQESDIITDLQTRNEIAPYPFENDGLNLDTMYPGGANQLSGLAIHDFCDFTSTTISGTNYIKGGNFPCGLIRIDSFTPAGAETQSFSMTLDLVPGTHRGYMAESMVEM